MAGKLNDATVTENNFCLIAIRPLKGCDKYFRKNLKENFLYKFYGEFLFLNGGKDLGNVGDEVTEIKIDNSQIVPKSLYHPNDKKFKFDLRISAIVGQNGSGKSSLLELFYASCFYLSHFEDLNYPENDAELKRQVSEIFLKLALELYFLIGDTYQRIIIKNGNCSKQTLVAGKWESNKTNQYPFYSIAVNYSLYGLNSSQQIDRWLNVLFHKNDGYQTPLVINPFREDGNIDVNKEFHLAQSRLITNIGLSDLHTYRLSEEINALQVGFTIDPLKLDYLDDEPLIAIVNRFERKNGIHVTLFFYDLMLAIVNYSIPDKVKERLFDQWEKEIEIDPYNPQLSKMESDNPNLLQSIDTSHDYLLYLMVKYVIKKVYRICLNYFDEYGDFLKVEDAGIWPRDYFFDIKRKIEFFQKIKEDESHITIKLKQALFSIKNQFYKVPKFHIVDNPRVEGAKMLTSNPIPIKNFRKIVKKFKTLNKEPMEELLIPASFFIPDIKVHRNESQSDSFDFKRMSSGEQQIVHSIQSIIYHITNVNSVHKSIESTRTKYEYINIILDEIELYYHPQYQKKFIYELIVSLKNTRIEYLKGINIIFSTHSPFILSDIANRNVMKLEKGEPIIGEEKTFAANIHDLLANDFFLQNGYFGEWAKYKLERYTEDGYNASKEDLQIIDLIGEPILRNSLRELLMQKKTNSEIDIEIARLQSLKR